MHLYRFLNKVEDLIFTFHIGRNRASYPETLANAKSPFLISVCFLSYHFPAFPSLWLTCLSRGPREAVVWRSGSAAPLGICLAPPRSVRAPSPWKPQAALQAALRVGRLELAEAIKERAGLEEPWKKLPV